MRLRLALRTQFALLIVGIMGINPATSLFAAKIIPPAPHYYVLDEPKKLSPNLLHALEELLVEHDRLTGQQFMIGIFRSLDEEKLPFWSQQLFSRWKIGKRGQDNGLLLSLFLNEHRAEVILGYGLEAGLPNRGPQEVVTDFIIPELKNNNLKRALIQGTYQILKALNSPLIQSGKADEILTRSNLDLALKDSDNEVSNWKIWSTLFLLGLMTLSVVLMELLSREAYFTGEGWYHPSPLQLLKQKFKLSTKKTHLRGTRGTW